MENNTPYLNEILTVEETWTRAHRDLNIAVIAEIMAPEYSQITADGRVIYRDEALASYRSGQRHWEFAQSDQLDVRIYGETALVIGRWRAKGTNHGLKFDYSARFSCVYVRRCGKWQIMLDHSTPIATPTGETNGSQESLRTT